MSEEIPGPTTSETEIHSGEAAASSEGDLVRRAKAGEMEAFGTLVQNCRKKIYALTFAMLQNPGDADEFSQQAFVKAFQSLDRFRAESRFSTWVYRIAANLCLDHLRRQKRTAVLAPESANKVESAVEEFERGYAREQVRKALDRLSPNLHAAVTLVYLEGHAPKEAASVLGCAEATVHWRLYRARKALKKELRSFSEERG